MRDGARVRERAAEELVVDGAFGVATRWNEGDCAWCSDESGRPRYGVEVGDFVVEEAGRCPGWVEVEGWADEAGVVWGRHGDRVCEADGRGSDGASKRPSGVSNWMPARSVENEI